MLIEVLSESTEAYDRGLKFARYRGIESLAEYVLFATDRPSVDVYRREPSGLWTLHPYSGLDATAAIESAGIELPLADIYAGLDFPPEPDAEPAGTDGT